MSVNVFHLTVMIYLGNGYDLPPHPNSLSWVRLESGNRCPVSFHQPHRLFMLYFLLPHLHLSPLLPPPRPLTIAEKTSARLCAFSLHPPSPSPVFPTQLPEASFFTASRKISADRLKFMLFSMLSAVSLCPQISDLPNSQEGRWSVLPPPLWITRIYHGACASQH